MPHATIPQPSKPTMAIPAALPALCAIAPVITDQTPRTAKTLPMISHADEL
jgi:hypothetical protein